MKSRLLMIVPADATTYHQLLHYCKEHGCETTVGHSVDASMAAAAKQNFDIVLIDSKVCLNGVIQAIRQLKTILPSAKYLISTDNTSRSLETVIRREGIFFYHINSFDISELQLAVQSAIDCIQKHYQYHEYE